MKRPLQVGTVLVALLLLGCAQAQLERGGSPIRVTGSNYHTNFEALARLVDEVCIQSEMDLSSFSSTAERLGLLQGEAPGYLEGSILASFDFDRGKISLYDTAEPQRFIDIPAGRTCNIWTLTSGTSDYDRDVINPLTRILGADESKRVQHIHGSNWSIVREGQPIAYVTAGGPSPPFIIEIYISRRNEEMH